MIVCGQSVRRSEYNFGELVFSFYHVSSGSRDGTQVIRLGSKTLYLLSHLMDLCLSTYLPIYLFLSVCLSLYLPIHPCIYPPIYVSLIFFLKIACVCVCMCSRVSADTVCQSAHMEVRGQL